MTHQPYPITRRQAAAWLSSLMLPLQVSAQDFPVQGRPVRIVIPAPPGGPADILARAIGHQLGPLLGNNTSVYVESKPGGASVPAALTVAQAPADGHTLLLTLNTTHTQVPHMFTKPPFDPFKDFTPITQVYSNGSVLVAHPSLPVSSLKELVAYSRTLPEPIPGGSPSPGTNGHFYIEMLNQVGAKLNHIPYKGSADAMRDLLGGFTKLQFDATVTALPHIQARRLKPLAVTGPVRLRQLPDVPTAQEQGFPALNITGWMGIFGPANLPPPVRERLNKALVQIVQSAQTRAQFEPLGLDLTGTTAAEFTAIVRNDSEAWGSIIKKIGIKLD